MAEIRTFVEDACTTAGIGREDCLKLLLIVEELFTNTVTHGYREESESPVWIAFDPCDTGFTFRGPDRANLPGRVRANPSNLMRIMPPQGSVERLVPSLPCGLYVRGAP